MGLIWCPVSNLFNLGRTLSLDHIQCHSSVALGTDSPLTAEGDLLDHIRFIARELQAQPALLYELVTTRAAHLLRLKRGEGSLRSGHVASFIAVRDRNRSPAETLTQISWEDIELVIESGRIVLSSMEMAARFPAELLEGLESIRINNIERLIRAPVQMMLRETFKGLGFWPDLSGRKLGPSLGPHTNPCRLLQPSDMPMPWCTAQQEKDQNIEAEPAEIAGLPEDCHGNVTSLVF
uniref:Amidohydrolase-related domain-containing protein n=2 Tax=Paracidobacterium acidisoli TaxID=2303751 RepID=A0A372ILD3_9BACT